jgi:hypothetical protein
MIIHHSIFPIVKTWNGDIGLHFDANDASWDQEAYQNLITSLSSCFYPPDIAEKSYVISPSLIHITQPLFGPQG